MTLRTFKNKLLAIARHTFIIIFISTYSLAFAQEQLIIEPDMGRDPIINAIQNARSSVQLVMYGLTDQSLISSLIFAKNTGKYLQVLLEPKPYKQERENYLAVQLLQPMKAVQFPNPDYKLTHQKTLVIDQNKAYVMTFNFTNASFQRERNFGLIIDDPQMVNEISRVFAADWQHKPIKVSHPNLIWSPNNSREKIINEISKAKSEIKIYAQSLTDYKIIGALAKAARSGLMVHILMSNDDEKNSRKFDFLIKAGALVRFSKDYMIHAKVIIIDGNEAILGSTNLTKPSLDDNRELSVITYDKQIINQLLHTFNRDWMNTSVSHKVIPEFMSFIIPKFTKWLRHTLYQLCKA